VRDAARVPLVPVVFNLDLGMEDGVAFAGLTYELSSNPRAYEAFELFVNASGSERALTLEWSYNSALFEPATITRLMSEFTALLQRLTTTPATNLRELAIPPIAMLHPAYQALNKTSQPYPATQNLTQLLAEQVARTPGALAVEQGTVRLSYQELDEQANRLAHHLRQQGVQAGDVVALALDRTPELLVALLACLKCGAPYLPLDPSYPSERLGFMLNDAQARLVLASVPLTDQPAVPVQLLDEALHAARQLPATAPALQLDSTAPLYILYTSGSTGQPKGVLVSHRNAVNLLYSMQQVPGLTATDRLLAVTTISFDMSVYELFLPLLSGATVVLASTEEARDGRQMLDLLLTAGITVLQTTPSRWRMLLEAGWQTALPLRAMCGGEPLPADLAAHLLAHCQAVWNLYGPTETTVYSTAKQVRAGETITIGRPIANTQCYILDEQMRPVAPGDTGELCIGGEGVAAGYWQRPTLTAERFLPDPFATAPEARLYRTGDLAQLLPNGEILCLGRLDQQVKLRGYRIELGEIEHALRALPGIRDAVVTLVQAATHDERLVAHVVLAAGHPAATQEPRMRSAQWRATLLRQLPAHYVPADYVSLPELPRTLNGKTDRAALTRAPRSAEPLPATDAIPAYVAPRTATEQLIASIWQECLGSNEPVGVLDNFFASGGHSIIALRVMVRLENATGKRLPLATLFEYPTVEKMAALLDASNQPLVSSSLVPIKPEGTRPPLYIVHGAGLEVLIFNTLPRNMATDQPVFALQAKGLNGEEVAPSTMEEMAAHYVAEVVAHNPSGPYALAGYSSGGIVAFEMAKQMIAAGRVVSFLGMLDTYAYQTTRYTPRLTNAWRNGVLQAKYLAFDLRMLLRQPRLVMRYSDNFALFRQLRRLLQYSKAERQHYAEGDLGPQAVIARKMHEQAVLNYLLAAQPVHVHVFRSTEQVYYLDDTEHLGWKEFAQQGVTVYDIPGNHYSILDAPYAQACAQALQRALDASQ
jgi:amino acid adenylation domain-containing protein